MVVIFFGTPAFAIPTLERLCGAHEVSGVMTQPDRPSGRNLSVKPAPVKVAAREMHIPILEAESVRDAALWRELESAAPDVIVVAAFGQIIPRELLEIPRYGCINVHASLLPRYRGAAPIQRALMDDMDRTGITIMQMDVGMDTGDILRQAEVLIGPEDDAGLLGAKLAEAGADSVIEALAEIEAGTARPRAQDAGQATYAPPIKKEESEIDWTLPGPRINNLIRALGPAPGAHTQWRGKRLKITKARSVPHETPPGMVDVHGESLFIGAGQGAVEALRVQPEGKQGMSAAEFVRGYRPVSGERMGDLI